MNGMSSIVISSTKFNVGQEAEIYAAALDWYIQAVKQGYSPTKSKDGHFGELGRFATNKSPNFAKALYWYRKAVRYGDTIARGVYWVHVLRRTCL